MLSVIIPTNNSERVLVPTLSALVPGAVAGLVSEVTLVDGGSTDRTSVIADAAGCAVVCATSVAGGLRTASARARAPWLMFLRPGFVPDSGWVGEVRQFVETVEDGEDARAATFRGGRPGARSTAGEIFALIGARFFPRPDPDRGLLISKRCYETLGGHCDGALDPEADLMRRIGRVTMLACGGKLPPKSKKSG